MVLGWPDSSTETQGARAPVGVVGGGWCEGRRQRVLGLPGKEGRGDRGGRGGGEQHHQACRRRQGKGGGHRGQRRSGSPVL